MRFCVYFYAHICKYMRLFPALISVYIYSVFCSFYCNLHFLNLYFIFYNFLFIFQFLYFFIFVCRIFFSFYKFTANALSCAIYSTSCCKMCIALTYPDFHLHMYNYLFIIIIILSLAFCLCFLITVFLDSHHFIKIICNI